MNASPAAEGSRVTVPLAVVQCKAFADTTNYREFVETVRAEMQRGAQHIVVDLTQAERISLAGSVALYATAAMLQGRQSAAKALVTGTDLEDVDGWELIHEISQLVEEHAYAGDALVVATEERVRAQLVCLGMNRLFSLASSVETALDELMQKYPA